MLKKIPLLLSVAMLIVGFLLGYQSANLKLENNARLLLAVPATTQSEINSLDFTLFWEVWEAVRNKYVDVEQLNQQKMLYGAIKGVVRSLGDPHSEYLDPEESEEFRESLEGSLTGIGAEIGIRDELLVIVSPLRGSPAEKAGLLPGDHIFKIDKELSTNLTIYEAVKKIRGQPGTQVILTILRDGELESREITITRDFIDLESVTTEMRSDGIAVVTLSTFAEDTAEEFTKKLAELILEQPKGVVLDLRFNGGGYLDAAVEITSKLLASGDVVIIHERNQPDQTLSVSGRPLLPQTPLVVLINEGSASSSEIVAGALQDAGRAKIVGQRSFGKGTVQELLDSFSDGSTLRITVAKWFTPSGRDVTEEGIEPDLEVKMTAEDWLNKRDPQLDAAVELLKAKPVENLASQS
jgi:carboxyl-terminal processing protease